MLELETTKRKIDEINHVVDSIELKVDEENESDVDIANITSKIYESREERYFEKYKLTKH